MHVLAVVQQLHNSMVIIKTQSSYSLNTYVIIVIFMHASTGFKVNLTGQWSYNNY